MVLLPNCKINLGLNIVGKRADGYHDIETALFPVPFSDALEIILAEDGIFEFHSTGLTVACEIEENLCVRAFRLLQHEFNLPAVKMHLHKVIPMGAGLGGGSSDCAFALKLLDKVFALGLNHDRLAAYARVLGSDCAFFIENKACFAFERGDRFEPVEADIAGLKIMLVIPGVHVTTRDAYSAIVPSTPVQPLKDILKLPADRWKDRLVNDFEVPVFEKHPMLGNIKSKLYEAGAIYASMSGSGSSLFGLFSEPPCLDGQFPGCYTWNS